MCPCCFSIESNTHIIQCTVQGSMETFATSIENLQKWMEGEIPEDIGKAIFELLLAVHENRRYNEEAIASRLHQVVYTQTKLGKHMIQWGILDISWRYFIEEYVQGTRKSAVNILANLCNQIWGITKDLWTHRCNEEYKEEYSSINTTRNNEANEAIDEIFNNLPSMRNLPMADRNFFRKNKEWRKKLKLSEKKKWIRRAKVIIRSYENIGEESSEARLMRGYFLAPD